MNEKEEKKEKSQVCLEMKDRWEWLEKLFQLDHILDENVLHRRVSCFLKSGPKKTQIHY